MRLAVQAKNGAWKHNVLGYPHYVEYPGWNRRFREWIEEDYPSELGRELIQNFEEGGAICTAMLLLEFGLRFHPIQLGAIPTMDEVQERLIDLVKRRLV